jgi:hypothetical protein
MTMIAERDYWMRARNDGHALQFKLKEAGAAEKRIGGGKTTQRGDACHSSPHTFSAWQRILPHFGIGAVR